MSDKYLVWGGIGTRIGEDVEGAPEWPRKLRLYDAAHRFLVNKAFSKGQTPILKTGAAHGMDARAAELVLSMGGNVELILPWPNYQSNWWTRLHQRYPNQMAFDSYRGQRDWTESVHKYHPAARNLKRGPFSLHARNYGIVIGCSCVVALPWGGPEGGGTGQGIRICLGESIHLYNLGVEQGRYEKEYGCAQLEAILTEKGAL